MTDTSDTFTVQADVRGPWRRFVDDIAPLRPDLFRYCRGLTGNVWDAEDLLQDALLRTFGALGKNDAELAHPRAYLTRVATHLWFDRLRRLRLERIQASRAETDPTAPDDPAQVVAVRAAAAALFQALPPRERAAVLLKDVMDFSLEETAALLRSTVGAVKSALHRGRATLAAAQAAPRPAAATPRAVVDRFVAALTARDFEAIRALCLADVSVDMVGGASFETYESGQVTLHFAHFVMPGLGDAPRWRTEVYEGEPIALGLRTLNGVEGVNEIWRLEAEDAGVERIRLYCFCPDLLAAVAADLGLPVLPRPYRSPSFG